MSKLDDYFSESNATRKYELAEIICELYNSEGGIHHTTGYKTSLALYDAEKMIKKFNDYEELCNESSDFLQQGAGFLPQIYRLPETTLERDVLKNLKKAGAYLGYTLHAGLLLANKLIREDLLPQDELYSNLTIFLSSKQITSRKPGPAFLSVSRHTSIDISTVEILYRYGKSKKSLAPAGSYFAIRQEI